MQLVMYIGNDLVESVPLEISRVSKPGYIGTFKRNLKKKYNDMIAQSQQIPEFLVTDIVCKNLPLNNASSSSLG